MSDSDRTNRLPAGHRPDDLAETADLPFDRATSGRHGHTGELGSEGGSLGDLTQRERAPITSSAAPAHRDSPALGGRLMFWLLMVALLCALLWWLVSTTAA